MRLFEIASNPELARAQQQLIKLGYNLGPTGADGINGPFTQAAARAYQAKNNLKQDGVIGPQTLASLGSNRTQTAPAAPPKTSAKQNQGVTVCLFKGMHTAEGRVGNASLADIAATVGGRLFEGRDSAGALQYYQTRPNTHLVVVGYSLGAEAVTRCQSAQPKLTITIAGWPTTLEQLSNRVQGAWHNFYQQRELDNILAQRYGRGPYRPQGGVNVPVSYNHAEIVGRVSDRVTGLIQQVK
jgi:hypothetical protein